MCGEAIAPSRLQVNAYAQRCFECQSDHEKKERHYRV
ncbi:TraR/DksA C4-type zinc finger protein [Limnobaculum xujianqingii]